MLRPQQPSAAARTSSSTSTTSPRRFDVIEGGRSGRSAPRAAPRRQAATPARQQGPQAGHLHAAHGAALGAPPPPGLLSPLRSELDSASAAAPATTARSGPASRARAPRCRPSPCATTRRSQRARAELRIERVHPSVRPAPASRSDRRPGRSVPAPPGPAAPPATRGPRPRPAPGRPRCGPARAVNAARASPARGRVRSRAARPRPLRRGGPGRRTTSRRRRWIDAHEGRHERRGPAAPPARPTATAGPGRNWSPSDFVVDLPLRRASAPSPGWQLRSGRPSAPRCLRTAGSMPAWRLRARSGSARSAPSPPR